MGKLLEPGWKVTLMHSCMDDVLAGVHWYLDVFLERLGSVSDTIRIERVGFSGDPAGTSSSPSTPKTTWPCKSESHVGPIAGSPYFGRTAHFSEAEEEYYTSIGYVQDDGGAWVAQSREAPAPSP